MNLLEKVKLLENEASDFGFQWENIHQIMSQIESECLEIREHVNEDGTIANSKELQHEIGDLLHAVFSLSVFCQFDPAQTLAQTLEKFDRRLQSVKAIAQTRGLTSLKGKPFQDLMNIWDEAKMKVG